MKTLIYFIYFFIPIICLVPYNSQAIPITNEFDIGGAFRINYGWKDYDDNSKLEFELFRLDVNYNDKKSLASAQFRWYQNQEVIHHAWVGYKFSEKSTVKLGVTQVPFGMLPYASHSFWFGATYYLGFEDDYDAGIHWQHESNNWQYDLAYFVNDEYGNGNRVERYSFDIATTDTHPYEEAGQINARIEKKFKAGITENKIGASVQLNNFDYTGSTPQSSDSKNDNVDGYAASVHWIVDWNNWQYQLQYIKYRYDTPSSRMAMSAFGYPFEVASEAEIYTTNLAYKMNVNLGPISSINCYNDFSKVNASGYGLDNSTLNVTGCMVISGMVYSYIDWIAGNNMWFSNGPGVGISSGDTHWHSRLNVNIGFYF